MPVHPSRADSPSLPPRVEEAPGSALREVLRLCRQARLMREQFCDLFLREELRGQRPLNGTRPRR